MLSFRAISAFAVLLAAAGAQAEKYVLGYMSETVKATRIYASPSTHSRAFCRVGAYERLITNPGTRGFERVLLRNGSSGYIAESALIRLPYKWVSDKPPRTSYTSRSAGMSFAGQTGTDIARYGMEFQGTPYKMGGTDVTTGIDCSAFVQKLYGDVAGIKLPRTAAEQALVGQPIYRLEQLQPGDRLYFFDAKRGKIGHTGVYVGGGYFVHSSHGRGGVDTSYLTESWRRMLVAARRGG